MKKLTEEQEKVAKAMKVIYKVAQRIIKDREGGSTQNKPLEPKK